MPLDPRFHPSNIMADRAISGMNTGLNFGAALGMRRADRLYEERLRRSALELMGKLYKDDLPKLAGTLQTLPEYNVDPQLVKGVLAHKLEQVQRDRTAKRLEEQDRYEREHRDRTAERLEEKDRYEREQDAAERARETLQGMAGRQYLRNTMPEYRDHIQRGVDPELVLDVAGERRAQRADQTRAETDRYNLWADQQKEAHTRAEKLRERHISGFEDVVGMEQGALRDELATMGIRPALTPEGTIDIGALMADNPNLFDDPRIGPRLARIGAAPDVRARIEGGGLPTDYFGAIERLKMGQPEDIASVLSSYPDPRRAEMLMAPVIEGVESGKLNRREALEMSKQILQNDFYGGAIGEATEMLRSSKRGESLEERETRKADRERIKRREYILSREKALSEAESQLLEQEAQQAGIDIPLGLSGGRGKVDEYYHYALKLRSLEAEGKQNTKEYRNAKQKLDAMRSEAEARSASIGAERGLPGSPEAGPSRGGAPREPFTPSTSGGFPYVPSWR